MKTRSGGTSNDATRCVRFDVHAVYLGHPGADMRCPAALVGRTDAVLVEPDDQMAGTAAAQAISPLNVNGMPVQVNPAARDMLEFDVRVPSLGVVATLTFGADDATAQAILNSFRAAGQ